MLTRVAAAGLLPEDPDLRRALEEPHLNALIELGPPAWREVLAAVAEGRVPDEARVPLDACVPSLPVRVRDYVDFYASEEHAANWARMLRPGRPALAENWRHMPVAYHGRASTVVVSGTPVTRPCGQVAPGELAPTRMLDLECEVGFVCGPSAAGPIPVDRAADHIFGVVLVNDWSARDVQRLEQPPLGPFLGKSFATSMSAWITPLDAVSDARVRPREQDPPPAGYLRAREPWALDVALEIELNGEVLSRPNASWLYWTPAQMLAHMTVNGATLTAGDLFATGTVSGSDPGTGGSLGEIGSGERWLADGDEVVLRGRAGDVELGEVRGRVLGSA
ncbi:MAG: fumarylacetoacetate hydrolase family protein [Actinomycetota bacterium]|nr:fumarylacetoacetate hydrolase family protein [Actinomycetota bacterium]